MSKIHILDNSLINKIAAGEVVERPASVVKELMENSIDAGADSISVEIQNGGINLIRITDNGKGIPSDQIETAFLRHATSKLETFEDLNNILTLGFRGEALSSIASVAQVEMITMTADDDIGTKIKIEGGNIIDKTAYAAKKGTVFTVKNLFFNTPARRKFLKKPAVESGYVSDAIYRIALGHPEVSIKFINNGNTVFQTNSSGNIDIKNAVIYIYGNDMAQSLLPVSVEKDGYSIKGYIGKPELNRGNRNYENFFIHGRYIKSKLISQAVEDAYKGRLMVGKFPVFMLNMTVPPSTVDVNVHPTKLEARFQNENFIYDLLYNAVADTLKKAVLIPSVTWDNEKKKTDLLKPSEFNTAVEENIIKKDSTEEKTVEKAVAEEQAVIEKKTISEKPTQQTANTTSKQDNDEPVIVREPHSKAEMANFSHKMNEVLSAIYPEKEAKKSVSEDNIKPVEQKHIQQTFIETEEPKKNFFSNYKIVGQLFNTYWIIEQGNSMYMIDQHAAHERALYEEFVEKVKSDDKPVVSQLLLQPLAISVTPRETALIEDNRELLESFGFELENFGVGAYALRAVPYILKKPSGAGFFMEILDELEAHPISTAYDVRLDAIATISCKAAVKANDRLSFSEAKELVEHILKLENPFSCPHGRPTIIEMSKYELEKKFKRIQG